ncbi:MAG: hypothetical protein B7Y61_23280 [Rhizobiales bacterium 35-66-30]|nr:MAG: hypothetical protein B7Y61_23280 [Rhizobiales bacterium 35-66-30]
MWPPMAMKPPNVATRPRMMPIRTPKALLLLCCYAVVRRVDCARLEWAGAQPGGTGEGAGTWGCGG